MPKRMETSTYLHTDTSFQCVIGVPCQLKSSLGIKDINGLRQDQATYSGKRENLVPPPMVLPLILGKICVRGDFQETGDHHGAWSRIRGSIFLDYLAEWNSQIFHYEEHLAIVNHTDPCALCSFVWMGSGFSGCWERCSEHLVIGDNIALISLAYLTFTKLLYIFTVKSLIYPPQINTINLLF